MSDEFTTPGEKPQRQPGEFRRRGPQGPPVISSLTETKARGGTAAERGKWTLNNAFITEVNFGQHSYDSEEMIDIVLSIQYDWAAYNPK